jgi:hypothetical protein
MSEDTLHHVIRWNVKIWGPDEQVIGGSSNSNAEVSHLSLTYPLTINHFLNRAI